MFAFLYQLLNDCNWISVNIFVSEIIEIKLFSCEIFVISDDCPTKVLQNIFKDIKVIL